MSSATPPKLSRAGSSHPGPDDVQYAREDLGDIVMDPKPRMTPYGEQDENGVDLSMIRSLLRRTPLERATINYRAARQLLQMRRDVRRSWQNEPATGPGRSAASGTE